VELNDILQNLVGGISIGSTYGLIGLGVVFLWQSINRINFANISSAMLSVYMFHTFYNRLNLGFTLSFLFAIVLVGVYGLGLRYFIYEPITRRGGARLEFVVATLMVTVFWLSVVNAIFGGLPKAFPPVFGEANDFVRVGGISLPTVFVWIFVVVAILIVTLHLFLRRTFLGKMLRATAQNKEAAELMGINVHLTTSIAFVLATTLVGIAGILLAPIYFVSLELGGGSIGIKGFASAVMGGLIDPYGTILGGIVIGTIENFSTLLISSKYKDIIAFALLILSLMWRPRGIFNWTTRGDSD
jgi:branched-chain amino acid transport system permease protein